MSSLIIPALILLATIPLVLGLMRANELFCLRVYGRGDRPSRVRVVRGRLPQALLDDLADVLQSRPVASAVVRVVHEGGRPAVYVEGDLSPEQRQRLRNVVSLWPVAKIRAAPRRR